MLLTSRWEVLEPGFQNTTLTYCCINKTVTGLHKELVYWYYFLYAEQGQIYNLITTVNRYYYTGKLELPRLYVLVHLRLIHSHSHLVWLSKICVRSLCVMSELLCPDLKVLVTTLMVSPIGINNHMICLWSFLIP